MQFVIRPADHIGARPDKFFKTTLFRGDALGQTQPPHDHADQDKFYYVLEGIGHFQVGEAFADAGPGEVVWAPAGVIHGVTNQGDNRLSLLVGIAPETAVSPWRASSSTSG
ncbi:MAG: cupin domain-containing protein [Anaerolineae bacterium]|nr:MAG: cupin domain-containing protein [Anaerolineae bacterium]